MTSKSNFNFVLRHFARKFQGLGSTNRVLALLSLGALCLLVVFVATTHAQSVPDSNLFGAYQTEIDKFVLKVHEWHKQTVIAVVLALLIGVGGALSAVFSSLAFKYAKLFAIILGALISISAVLQHTLYSTDYKTLSKQTKKAKEYLDDIDTYKQKFLFPSTSEGERILLSEKIQEKILALYALRETMDSLTSYADAGQSRFDLVPSAWAGEGSSATGAQPAWVLSTPKSTDFLYFKGNAVSSDAGEALDEAKKDAQNEAREFFKFKVAASIQGNGADSLSSYLATNLEKVDIYYNFDKSKNEFSVYALYKLSSDLTRLKAGTYFIGKGRSPLPQNVVQNIAMQDNAFLSYYERREDRYRQQLQKASADMDAPSLKLFVVARSLRKSGEASTALTLFNQVLSKNKTFELGWYNLALTYESLDSGAKAESAYKKAIALDSAGKVYDPSLYNSFGAFLITENKQDLAKNYLQLCLKFDPSHPLAQRNLNWIESMKSKRGN